MPGVRLRYGLEFLVQGKALLGETAGGSAQLIRGFQNWNHSQCGEEWKVGVQEMEQVCESDAQSVAGLLAVIGLGWLVLQTGYEAFYKWKAEYV